MKRFLILSLGTPDAPDSSKDMSPEAMASGMAAWMAWRDQYADQVLDLGAPIVGGLQLHADGRITPDAVSASGYMMVQAPSMEAAVALLQSSPLFPTVSGCHLEIHEMQNMPMD